ncbi:MAG: tetratricopeptide repeat protein, partial [Parvularculaceae bacterium]
RASRETPPSAQSVVAANLRQGAIMGVGAVPLAAIALYLGIGAADRISPAPSATSGAVSGVDPARPVSELLADLEKRLADNPNDMNGWVTLGESYAEFNRYADAAKAFAKAVDLDPNSAFLQAAHGEALVLANRGSVTDEANAAFARALDVEPREPRARYYLALRRYQQGDKAEALKALAALVNDAPDGAPWLPIAQNELVSVAMELKQTLEEAGLSESAQARLEQMMAAQSKGAPDAIGADRATEIAAIEALISSGEAKYTDWLRLADVHRAAGDRGKAEETLARARERYAAAPFVLQEIAAAEAKLLSAAPQDAPARRGPTASDITAAQSMSEEDRQTMIKGMVEGLAARLDVEPDDLDGWLMLGRSYGVLGDFDKSVGAFARAAALRPDDLGVQVAYAQALIARSDANSQPIDAATETVLNNTLTIDENQPFALYFLGLAAKQKSDKAAARRHWERLASSLPADSPDAKEIADLLNSLDTP